MNAERLLLHYEQIADAPDAIARLRRFILDLAVRGKLVPQDPADETASELLKQIVAEKAFFETNKRTKVSSVTILRACGELPSNWVWSTFSEISLRLHYGFTASADQKLKDVRLLRITDIQDGKVNWDDVPGCAINDKAAGAYLLEPGDILIARTGGTIGKTFLVSDTPVKSVFASYLIRLQPARALFDRYIKLFCDTSLYWDQLSAGSRGGGQPNVNGQTLGSLLFPLPPLDEQHRIVAKVDELMALIDELEEVRTKRDAKRDKLAAASLVRLNEPDPETFHDDARFALDALPALTARPDQIKQLRQTILNLAVRGKLVPQDPADEPAEELLRQILEVRNGITRSSKKISIEDAIVQSDNSLSGWVSATVQDVAEVGTGSTPTSTDSSYYSNGHIPWLTSSASGLDEIISADNFVTEKAVREFRLKIYPPGSLLVALYGQGKTRGQVAKLSLSATVNQACAVITWIAGFEDLEKFMLLIFRQQYHEMRLKAEGGAQPNLNLRKIKELKIPLPPLAEQHRIVAKVDELMALCDQLEASLTNADETREKLLDALLAEALAPVETIKIQEVAG